MGIIIGQSPQSVNRHTFNRYYLNTKFITPMKGERGTFMPDYTYVHTLSLWYIKGRKCFVFVCVSVS